MTSRPKREEPRRADEPTEKPAQVHWNSVSLRRDTPTDARRDEPSRKRRD